MFSKTLSEAGFGGSPTFWVEPVEGTVARTYTRDRYGHRVDLGEVRCVMGMSSRAQHGLAADECWVLGCPVHTPNSCWEQVRRLEAYVAGYTAEFVPKVT